VDDARLAEQLAGRAACPYPGTWQQPPYAERAVDGVRYALVAVDPGLSALGVRRDDGSLWGLPDGAEPHLVNSGVPAFVAFTGLYAAAAAEAEAYEGPDDEDDEAGEDVAAEDAADALTEELTARFREVDAPAVADENAFWCVAAEELGYSMST
jgi:hypothetical protein